MRSALTIAGSDPTGGAGLQADLQVFRAHGVHGCAITTALTIQDTQRVHRVLPVFPSALLDQLRVLLADVTPGAVKIGMLGTDDILRNVSLGLAGLPPEVPVVVDPVLISSDGTPLLERRAWPGLRELIAQRTLVTPNLPEAEALTGEDVSSRTGRARAALELIENAGVHAALIKGGHSSGAPDDLLAYRAPAGTEALGRETDPIALRWLPGERIETEPVHGTGCALSSAIAARLALGTPLLEAVEGARRFVAKAIANAARIGGGAPVLVYPNEAEGVQP
jgi:hydroxymethylpyrimidine kinase/phosphomethylpyrimidine kinase